MRIGQIGKSAYLGYSGVKAKISTPVTAPEATGDIKGAIFTSGLIELGWVYRNWDTYPNIYYQYYDATAATPELVEVAIESLPWKRSKTFEIKWIGDDKYSLDNLDQFDILVDNVLITTVTSTLDWEEENFWIGLYADENEDEVGFSVKNAKLFKLENTPSLNDYELLKDSSERNTGQIQFFFSIPENTFVVKTENWLH
jgi:hypothetical protein